MNKSIKYLIESSNDNLFDDIYDPNDVYDIISNDLFNDNNLGNIYYYKKKPYAICCGLAEDFKDKKDRYVLCKKEQKSVWCKQYNDIYRYTLSYNFFIRKKSDIRKIDETGYINTNYIKRNFNFNNNVAIKLCLKYGDNAYLPAIDELQHLYFNISSLNNILNYYKLPIINLNLNYWSSTLLSQYTAARIHMNKERAHIINFNLLDGAFIKPFIKID
jgi:hypothetical protein